MPTTLNTDLILKLIRLANNNPNDNEANLAARKVCKMLADYKFNNVANPFVVPPTTWNDVKRSTEPRWSSRPPPNNPYNPYTARDFVSWFQEYTEQIKRDQPRGQPPISYDEETKRKPYRDSYDVACIICGKIVNVKHSRDSKTFKCATCAWQEVVKP